jgi:hypothetical protein
MFLQVRGRTTEIAPRGYYSAVIEMNDDGYLPKTVLISDDLCVKSLLRGFSYDVSGFVINRFHDYPPVIFPEYATMAPTITTHPMATNKGGDIKVSASGKVTSRMTREAWKDTLIVMEHRVYDPSVCITLSHRPRECHLDHLHLLPFSSLQDLCWVTFQAHYLFSAEKTAGYEEEMLQIGNKLSIMGHVASFSNLYDAWQIQVRCI